MKPGLFSHSPIFCHCLQWLSSSVHADADAPRTCAGAQWSSSRHAKRERLSLGTIVCQVLVPRVQLALRGKRDDGCSQENCPPRGGFAPRALLEIVADEPSMFTRCHLAAAAARLRTLNRAAPAQLGVVPVVQHGSRELCTGLPKWRLRNKKIIGKSTGVFLCQKWPPGIRGPSAW